MEHDNSLSRADVCERWYLHALHSSIFPTTHHPAPRIIPHLASDHERALQQLALHTDAIREHCIYYSPLQLSICTTSVHLSHSTLLSTSLMRCRPTPTSRPSALDRLALPLAAPQRPTTILLRDPTLHAAALDLTTKPLRSFPTPSIRTVCLGANCASRPDPALMHSAARASEAARGRCTEDTERVEAEERARRTYGEEEGSARLAG